MADRSRGWRPSAAAASGERGTHVWGLRTPAYDDRRRVRSTRLPRGLSLAVLGPFELTYDGGTIELPPRLERVVAYLALHRGPATRPNVAGTLWGDTPEDRALASLRSALWRLRRAGLPMIDGSGDHLALSPIVAVDLYELTDAAHDLIDGATPSVPNALDRLARADDLLGDWYEDWILVERERFRQLRLQALERHAGQLSAAGEYGRAAESALAAIAAEPLRESAHRALIGIHLAQGNVGEAVRQYEIFRDLIREELDVEPSRAMRELLGTPLIRKADGRSVGRSSAPALQ